MFTFMNAFISTFSGVVFKPPSSASSGCKVNFMQSVACKTKYSFLSPPIFHSLIKFKSASFKSPSLSDHHNNKSSDQVLSCRDEETALWFQKKHYLFGVRVQIVPIKSPNLFGSLFSLVQFSSIILIKLMSFKKFYACISTLSLFTIEHAQTSPTPPFAASSWQMTASGKMPI